ncbi:hypothetical protein MMC12_003625 [Toensbergia leucococca]|nr:hypothetical protein [Toensbergia leucococca]
MTQKGKSNTNYDFHPNTNSEEGPDIFVDSGNMDGTGGSSPFIKDEPDDYTFTTNSYVPNQQGYGGPMNQQFGESTTGSIDPSELTMQANSFGQYNFGSQQNMSSSFNMGNSIINDDELLDLDLNDTPSHRNQFHADHHTFGGHENGNLHEFFPEQGQSGSTMVNNQNQMNPIYSSTPDGAPIQSPFTHGNFNYAQYGQIQPQHMAQQASPYIRPSTGNTHGRSMDNGYMNGRPRPNVPTGTDRRTSDSRSPMTPKTPALGGLNLGTPESGSISSQPIHTNGLNQHRHQKSLSNQWDSTPGSLHSYIDSPIPSPGHAASHAQISEILKSGKHASLPAKVDTSYHPAPAYQTQEAKRRKRRESHNMVERRRRDNINERIQELSHLVPQHRLEDEKVRKHLVSNSPLSPTLAATGISPPQATSLLAAGGRRATGAGITMGIPVEEKDKGPNKGDILNGAVSWTRDLMWALHAKLEQEAELADLITSLGGVFPFEQSEDEKRMRTELLDAMENNEPSSFAYTRGAGSGLRVPKHTNVAGEPLNQGQMGVLSPQSLSPGVQSGGSGANSGGHGQPQFWSHSGRSLSFKEEDEYDMEMN